VLVLLVVEARSSATGSPVFVLAPGVAFLTALVLVGLALSRREADREASERALQADRLAEAQRFATMGLLAGAAAHDFKNLITAINGIAYCLRKQRGDEENAAALDQVAEHTLETCDRLLSIGRSTGEGPTRLELHEVVRNLAPLAVRLLPRRIRLEIDARGVSPVVADRAQIEMALINVLVNARDAIEGKGEIILRTDEVGPAEDADLRLTPGLFARVLVRDSGAGIPGDVKDRVLEPFFTTKGAEGTGLGLALVADVARKAGGHVRIQSEEGKGTPGASSIRPESAASDRRDPSTARVLATAVL
jgi:signal transduction histidine kinase